MIIMVYNIVYDFMSTILINEHCDAGDFNMSIFQVTDLAKHRTEVLEAARQDTAIIRDNQGPELVMLQMNRLKNLETYKEWSLKLERLRDILQSGNRPNAVGWGDLAWLRVFDDDDLRSFCTDLSNELVIDAAEDDFSGLEQLLREWKVTAGQLEDPLRKHILLSPRFSHEEFIEASEPNDNGTEVR